MRTTTVSRSKVPSPSRSGGGWSHNSHRQYPALHVEWSRYYHEWRTRQYHQSKVHAQILHETILNNNHSTKEYQLKLSGYFGDDGDKDKDYLMNWNKGMEQRHLCFW